MRTFTWVCLCTGYNIAMFRLVWLMFSIRREFSMFWKMIYRSRVVVAVQCSKFNVIYYELSMDFNEEPICDIDRIT